MNNGVVTVNVVTTAHCHWLAGVYVYVCARTCTAYDCIWPSSHRHFFKIISSKVFKVPKLINQC